MPAITNPARLLHAGTFTPQAFLKCYVLGCYDEATRSVQHKQFGRVASCAAHDPARFGVAVVFGYPPVAAIPAALPVVPTSSNGDGGQRVPVLHPPKPLSPQGTALRPF